MIHTVKISFLSAEFIKHLIVRYFFFQYEHLRSTQLLIIYIYVTPSGSSWEEHFLLFVVDSWSMTYILQVITYSHLLLVLFFLIIQPYCFQFSLRIFLLRVGSLKAQNILHILAPLVPKDPIACKIRKWVAIAHTSAVAYSDIYQSEYYH